MIYQSRYKNKNKNKGNSIGIIASFFLICNVKMFFYFIAKI